VTSCLTEDAPKQCASESKDSLSISEPTFATGSQMWATHVPIDPRK